jgi:hypothetical protein
MLIAGLFATALKLIDPTLCMVWFTVCEALLMLFASKILVSCGNGDLPVPGVPSVALAQ